MTRHVALVMGLLLWTVVLGARCGGRTLGADSNRSDGDGSVSTPDARAFPDAGRVADAGPGTCEADQTHQLRAVRLTSLYLLQDTPMAEGQTVRIAAGMTFGGCEDVAQVEVQVDHTARTVSLIGTVWNLAGPNVVCPDVALYGEEIIALPNLSAGEWRVYERLSGLPGLETSFVINVCGGAVDCFCNTWNPAPGWVGDDCTFNCECDPSLQCLAHLGLGGPFSICGQSCSANADCLPWQECRFMDDGAWGVCWDVGPLNSCPAEGCRPGFTCQDTDGAGSFCQATFDGDVGGGLCACDQECPTGYSCVDTGITEAPFCAAICRGPADCPAGGLCGADLPDTPPYCLMMWM